MYHEGPDEPLGQSPLHFFRELFELATRAPHATTVGLRRDVTTDQVIPVLKDERSELFDLEQRDTALVTSIQAGIFDFTDVYALRIPFMQESAADLSARIVSRLDRFMRLPSVEEGSIVSDFFHMEDFGSDTVAFKPGRLGKSKTMRRLFNITGKKSQFAWPEGTAAASGLPGMVFISNVIRLLRKHHY
jgi:hypothetical protein